MLKIQDAIVSLDIIERYFLCDISTCHGCCCVEGDAGAPITPEEYEKLQELTPIVWEYLSDKARDILTKQGPAYYDADGDLVTSIVDGKDCVFTTYDDKGTCLCALEKAYRDGKTDFQKPESCHLYPARLAEYAGMTAVNFHRWDICRAAEILGRSKKLRAYQFLKTPLIKRFGKEWYDELCLAAEEWLRQSGLEK